MPAWRASCLFLILATSSQAAERAAAPIQYPAKGSGVSIQLANGSHVEGEYDGQREGAVWVKLDQGEIGIDESTIVSIQPMKNATTEFNKRLRATPSNDANAHWELAVWAQEHGLDDSARLATKRVIALDPEHLKARQYLGHEKLNGVWLDQDAAMRAKGFVEHNGRWISRLEYAMLEREERRAESERAQSRQDYYDRLQYEQDSMILRYNTRRAIRNAEYLRPRTIYDPPIISRPVFYGPAKRRR